MTNFGVNCIVFENL